MCEILEIQVVISDSVKGLQVVEVSTRKEELVQQESHDQREMGFEAQDSGSVIGGWQASSDYGVWFLVDWK